MDSATCQAEGEALVQADEGGREAEARESVEGSPAGDEMK